MSTYAITIAAGGFSFVCLAALAYLVMAAGEAGDAMTQAFDAGRTDAGPRTATLREGAASVKVTLHPPPAEHGIEVLPIYVAPEPINCRCVLPDPPGYASTKDDIPADTREFTEGTVEHIKHLWRDLR